MRTELPIFLNPSAGDASRNERALLEAAFHSAGAGVVIREARGPVLQEALAAAVKAGTEVVGVAGGDGTISAAAHVLANTRTALLPIPLGTMNHFAKRYGIASIDAAALAWQRSSGPYIDVGCVNGRIFVNNASCGFYPHVVRHRETIERVLPRLPAMWLAGMRVLLELPIMKLQIDADGKRRDVRTAALWVGIGRNSLRLPLPGDAEQEGSVLELVAGRSQTRLGILATAFRLFRHLKRGVEPKDEKLEVLRGKHFFLQSRKSVDIALDGEPYSMHSPIEFSIQEKALRVICLVGPGA